MPQQGQALRDVLSAEKLIAVRSLLEVMAEPLSRSLAPVEEEEITAETAAAPRQRDRGEGISHDEILRECRPRVL
jgi:hypothetical protein